MPLRVGALTSLGVFLIAFTAMVTSSGNRAVVASLLGILGADGLVWGMILATNYRSCASAYAELYSVSEVRSWLRIYIRGYGVVSMIGGAAFVAVSVLLIFARTP
jgi:hypothetical protein